MKTNLRGLLTAPSWRGWSLLAVISAAGIVLAGVSGLGIAVVAAALVAVQVVRVTPPARRWRAWRAHSARRRELRERREEQLDARCAPALDLDELTELVDRCTTAGDPFELDALLDQYAKIALARHRCRRVLGMASPSVLEAKLAMARVAHPVSASLIERRIAHAYEVGRMQHELDEQLAEIGELVRYYAARALVPDVQLLLENELVAEVLERV
jgi:hypothetical protein